MTTNRVTPERRERLRHDALHEVLDRAAHLLPEQAPLDSFVHHNPLHVFEDLPFEEAVEQAALQFGTEPYPSLDEFAGHLDTGRIRFEDVDAVLADKDGALDAPLWPGGPRRRDVWRGLLLEAAVAPGPETAAWLVAEGLLGAPRRAPTPGWAKARGEALWQALRRAAPRIASPAKDPRPRDVLLARTGVDIDDLIQPLLIRFCAAYLDQGLAYWRMPGRDRSMLEAFRDLYGRRLGPPDSWMRGLQSKLQHQAREAWSAERTVLTALDRFGLPSHRWEAFIRDTLLSLRGWAGMVRQLEVRPERAPVRAPPARLIDYLAVQLVLKEQAATWALARHEGHEDLQRIAQQPSPRKIQRSEEGVHDAFILAQHLDLDVDALIQRPARARTLMMEVAALSTVRRRKLLHAAYERRHRVVLLDALTAAASRPADSERHPYAQVVFCIDDREESTRRHLEEVDPDVETLGYAGFFGIPMAYQGLRDIRPRPLCPVSTSPRHLVVEVPTSAPAVPQSNLRSRADRSVYVGSRTLFRGTLFTSLLGVLSVLPLLLGVLFPRWAGQIARRLRPHERHDPTRVVVAETGEVRSTHLGDLQVGFPLQDRVGIVRDVLTAMGIAHRLSGLVVMMGHGSSSLNNPHEAAHDCGATGGGRGGPNARAFAAMANDPEVRAELSAAGLEIPEGTAFVGAYHNTCDDAVTYYDLDLLPEDARPSFERLRDSMDETRRRDARERVRRFETDRQIGSAESMLAIAEAHAVDLAQPRPEYGHATNAVCIVGRREATRGLFLDRRAFLVSYDPERDPDHSVLAGLLASVAPVGAGINLEYYFSYIDPVGYGSGTKLPHNVTGLLGVMDGHASDLRTGLPWQMVEIHEPVRMLTVIEAEPETLTALLERDANLERLVVNRWIQVVAWSPKTRRLFVFRQGKFVDHREASPDRDVTRLESSSVAAFKDRRGHIDPTLIVEPEVPCA